jgi:hypothetical protein
MAVRKVETLESVSLGHIPDHMPDDTPIRPLGSRMVCTRCGHVGADVRPDWGSHVNKRHV